MGHSKEALAVTERDVRLYVDKAKNWKRKKKKKYSEETYFSKAAYILRIYIVI